MKHKNFAEILENYFTDKEKCPCGCEQVLLSSYKYNINHQFLGSIVKEFKVSGLTNSQVDEISILPVSIMCICLKSIK